MRRFILFLLPVLLFFVNCSSQRNSLTPYECALLSAHVYDSGEVEQLPKHIQAFQDFDPDAHRPSINIDLGLIKRLAEEEAWGKLVPYVGAKVFGIGGYFGRAYVIEKNNQLVIAHRGTDIDLYNQDNLENFFSMEDGQFWKSLKDFDDDYDILAGNIPEQQFKSAREFVEHSIEAYQKQYGKTPEVIHTGHSLGAVLAELCAADDENRAITFESPGTKPMIEQLTDRQEVNWKAINITIYNTEPNSINTLHEQSGKVVPLYEQQRNALKNFLMMSS